MAYFWECYTNRQDPDNPAIYEREDELLIDGAFEIWLSTTNLRYWVENIAGGSTTITRSTDTYDEDSAYAVEFSIDAVPNAAYIFRNSDTKPGRKHIARIRYKNDSGGEARIVIRDPAGNVYLNSSSHRSSHSRSALRCRIAP